VWPFLLEALLLLELYHLRLALGLLELQREGEGTALAVGGVDPDLTSHHLDELLADGEA